MANLRLRSNQTPQLVQLLLPLKLPKCLLCRFNVVVKYDSQSYGGVQIIVVAELYMRYIFGGEPMRELAKPGLREMGPDWVDRDCWSLVFGGNEFFSEVDHLGVQNCSLDVFSRWCNVFRAGVIITSSWFNYVFASLGMVAKIVELRGDETESLTIFFVCKKINTFIELVTVYS
jgi:hypothetical protein